MEKYKLNLVVVVPCLSYGWTRAKISNGKTNVCQNNYCIKKKKIKKNEIKINNTNNKRESANHTNSIKKSFNHQILF